MLLSFLGHRATKQKTDSKKVLELKIQIVLFSGKFNQNSFSWAY